jgi:integrase
MSPKLAGMLKTLPQKSDRVFGAVRPNSLRSCYSGTRKHLARKFNNPRLLNVKLHTFRHWKATMEYHKTRDILYVKQLLGHRSLQSTLVYTQLIGLREDDAYHCKVAKTEQEKTTLIEGGFDHVATDPDGTMYFRKRK